MTKDSSDLCGQLRKAILNSGLTHFALGKLAGVAPAQLGRFMSGKRDIRLETAAKLAAALNLQLTGGDKK